MNNAATLWNAARAAMLAWLRGEMTRAELELVTSVQRVDWVQTESLAWWAAKVDEAVREGVD